MASVWAARIQGTRGFEKLVAIKTILPHLADDPQFETMFLDEARIASEIVHPNIAQVFDLGEQDGVLFLVCEWVDGESLATLRKRVVDQGQEIPIPIALRIMSDVCGGLHAAHELRDVTGKPLHVVHRDVSPQNIVISDAGAVKVIDFGVAKAQNRKLDQTVAGKLKGKVQYMPPEQARGLPVDRRTDLWSVGAVLYHLLAGRTPYEADSPLAVLNLLLSEEAPPPLPAHVPESVADIVFQALRPNPIERFQTAAEMQIAIAMALRNVSMPIPDAAIGEFVRRYVGAQAKQRHQLIAEAIEAANHAPPPPADLTLVEVVEAVEELISKEKEPSSPASPPEAVRPPPHEKVGQTLVAPFPAPAQPPIEPENEEPVLLVRRSRADWTPTSAPTVVEHPVVNEPYPMAQDNRAPSLAPSAAPSPAQSPPRPTPNPSTTAVTDPAITGPRRAVALPAVPQILVAVVVFLAVIATFALFWPKTKPPLGSSPALSASETAKAVLPQSSAEPNPSEHDDIPIVSGSDLPTVAPSIPDSSRLRPKRPLPGSTVPPPPPGWESLPSLTLEPESP